MPALEKSFSAILGDVFPTIRLDFKFSVLTDLGKVSRDGTELRAASGDFDHDLRGASPDGSADLLNLRGREAAGLRRTHSCIAEQIQVRAVGERHAKRAPTQSDSPRR